MLGRSRVKFQKFAKAQLREMITDLYSVSMDRPCLAINVRLFIHIRIPAFNFVARDKTRESCKVAPMLYVELLGNSKQELLKNIRNFLNPGEALGISKVHYYYKHKEL